MHQKNEKHSCKRPLIDNLFKIFGKDNGERKTQKKTTKSPNFVAGVTFSNLWIKSLDSTCFFLLTDELLMCVKVWISGNRMIRSYAYPEDISHFWLTNTRVWFNKHTPRLKVLLALFGFSYKLLLVYVSCTCLIAPCHRRVIAEM